MKDIYYFENLEQIRALREPMRWKMLDLLIARPMTGSQLARALGITRSLAHYHLKILEKVGLVIFVEERLLEGVVEKYYQALARQYRSDHLVDSHRSGDSQQNGTSIQTGEAVGELMRAMIEVARSDIARPEANDQLAKMGFNFQDEIQLTPKQLNELIKTLRSLGEQYVQIDQENRSSGKYQDEELLRLRFTWLFTPVDVPNSSEKESKRRKKVINNKETP